MVYLGTYSIGTIFTVGPKWHIAGDAKKKEKKKKSNKGKRRILIKKLTCRWSPKSCWRLAFLGGCQAIEKRRCTEDRGHGGDSCRSDRWRRKGAARRLVSTLVWRRLNRWEDQWRLSCYWLGLLTDWLIYPTRPEVLTFADNVRSSTHMLIFRRILRYHLVYIALT